MLEIPATQFLRPDGRIRHVKTRIPVELSEQWSEIVDCGIRLTVEELTTLEVSICLEAPEGDFACEVVPNGPPVAEARNRMIAAFRRKDYELWREEVESEGYD